MSSDVSSTAASETPPREPNTPAEDTPDQPDVTDTSTPSSDADVSVSPATLQWHEHHDGGWGVWLVAILGLLALGLVYAEPLLLAAAVVPTAYIAYGAVSSLPNEVSLAVERSLAGGSIAPGESVDITLRVTNVGDAVIPDLRIVDGVPAELVVTEGSPRGAVALRPGSTTEIEYTVIARRGEFAFTDPQVTVRSLAGTDRAALSVEPEGETTVECTRPGALPTPARSTPRRVGQTTSNQGGEGLEFHSTREYRTGDARSRVNWRQYAKSGSLVTTEFRRERAASAVVVLDVREATRRSAMPGRPTGAETSAYAAEAVVEQYLAAGHDVDLVVMGLSRRRVDAPVEAIDGILLVTDVNTDAGYYRARATFEAAAAVATERSPKQGGSRDGLRHDSGASERSEQTAARVLARADPNAEVVVVSSLPDYDPVTFVRRSHAMGRSGVLLSPDNTGDATRGGRIAGVHRELRLQNARGVCDVAIDWGGEEPLGLAVARAVGGGQR
ncbi:DUF58 domain-containing protein [Halobaculum lipolyticum]|uniref:DUF58 domain-containing protein n=1 Tax=Halobaculum lipolyticum TaxID=3032001 RepID=A0ABD5WB40_9EURY|nr:DUF58 domain-containing protein [Halobaculum sp. DT31]